MNWWGRLTGVVLVGIWVFSETDWTFTWWFGAAVACAAVSMLTEKEEECEE